MTHLVAHGASLQIGFMAHHREGLVGMHQINALPDEYVTQQPETTKQCG